MCRPSLNLNLIHGNHRNAGRKCRYQGFDKFALHSPHSHTATQSVLFVMFVPPQCNYEKRAHWYFIDCLHRVILLIFGLGFSLNGYAVYLYIDN